MIVNFHPKEIESKKGLEIINKLSSGTNEKVLHVSEKTYTEWQEIIKSNEKLVFVAPVYWWALGYEFDKWLQNVFTYNFAYVYDSNGVKGLLNKREFEIHLTHGTPDQFAEGMKENIRERLNTGIFGFSDAKVEISFYQLS